MNCFLNKKVKKVFHYSIALNWYILILFLLILQFYSLFSYNEINIKDINESDKDLEHSLNQVSNKMSSGEGETIRQNRLQQPNPPFGGLIYDIPTTVSTTTSTLRFSPSGNILAVSGSSNKIEILNVSTGIFQTEVENDNPAKFALSSSGRTLFTLNELNQSKWDLKSWDTFTGKLLSNQSLDLDPQNILFSPDGRFFLSNRYGRGTIWDSSTGKIIMQYGKYFSYLLQFSPDGSSLLFALYNDDSYYDYKYGILNLTLGTFLPHYFPSVGIINYRITPNFFTPDGNHFIFTEYLGNKSYIKYWDFIKNINTSIFEIDDNKEIYLKAISSNGLFISFQHGNALHILNTQTASIVLTVPYELGVFNSISTFSPDSTMLVVSSNGKITFRNMIMPRNDQILLDPFEIMDYNPHYKSNSLVFSPDGFKLAFYDGIDIKIWELQQKNLLYTLKGNILYNDSVNALAFSPDSKYLASVYENGSVKLFNVSSGIVYKNFSALNSFYTSAGHSNMLSSTLFFSENGSNLFLCLPYKGLDKIISWDVNTGSKILDKQIVNVTTLFLSDQNELLAVTNNNNDKLTIFAVANNSIIKEIYTNVNPFPYFRDFTFDISPDNKYLAMGGGKCGGGMYPFWYCYNGSLLVWNIDTNVNVINLSLSQPVSSIDFSADGSMMSFGHWDCLIPLGCHSQTKSGIEIWNMNNFTLKQKFLDVNNFTVTSLAFSPDSNQLISLGSNGIVLWDISVFPMKFDSDLDGMEDSWEEHYQLQSTYFWDKFDDNDQDGLMNSMEFFLGTNPMIKDFEFEDLPYDDELNNEKGNPNDNNLIIVFLVIMVTILSIASYFYLKKQSKSSITTELDVFESDIGYLRPLYHKIIIGLENVKNLFLSNSSISKTEEELEKTKNSKTETISVVTFLLPTDFRDDLKSEIRGRTVLVLVELAYQYPLKSHASYISKMLNIPSQTMSVEINRLLNLNYIEPLISKNTLNDSRYKFYSLTKKGFLFLSLLKETLSITMMNVTIKSENNSEQKER